MSLYIYLKKRYSHSTVNSYHRLCSPLVRTSRKNPQIEQIVLEDTTGFSFIKICFLISFTSRNFGFIVFENQVFNVSIVNFNLAENNSVREVDF